MSTAIGGLLGDTIETERVLSRLAMARMALAGELDVAAKGMVREPLDYPTTLGLFDVVSEVYHKLAAASYSTKHELFTGLPAATTPPGSEGGGTAMSDRTHPIDLVERVRLKIAFLSDIDNRDVTVDGDKGLFFLLQDMDDQLADAVKLLNEMTYCTGCNGQSKGE